MAVAVAFFTGRTRGTVAGFFMNDGVKERDDMGDGSRRRFRLDTGCALGTSGTSVQHGGSRRALTPLLEDKSVFGLYSV